MRILEAAKCLLDVVPEAAPFLADWPSGQERRVCLPGQLPVCEWLGQLDVRMPLVAAIVAEAERLTWRQTYGAADFGEAFLRGYGWSEFIGLRGPIASDDLACGVLLLGPGVIYPAHAHQAEEIYMPLSGVAEWQQGSGEFAPVTPGAVIHHAPWVPHAIRCGSDPLLALYLWRGGDLAAKSVILG